MLLIVHVIGHLDQFNPQAAAEAAAQYGLPMPPNAQRLIAAQQQQQVQQRQDQQQQASSQQTAAAGQPVHVHIGQPSSQAQGPQQ